MPESTRQPVEFPDGGRTYMSPIWPGPAVQVRFPDGGLVEFRPATDWPKVAHIYFAGLEVKGLRLDIRAHVEYDGQVSVFSTWKTDVAGIDGGGDVPAGIRDAVLKLCRKRTQEARDAINAVIRPPRMKLADVPELLGQQPGVQAGSVV